MENTTKQVDREALCMQEGCDQVATWFEEDTNYWHDWVWCTQHAPVSKQLESLVR